MTGRETEKEVFRTLEKVHSPGTVLLSDLACLNRFLFNIKPRHCKQVYNEGHLTRQVSLKGRRRLKIWLVKRFIQLMLLIKLPPIVWPDHTGGFSYLCPPEAVMTGQLIDRRRWQRRWLWLEQESVAWSPWSAAWMRVWSPLASKGLKISGDCGDSK